MGGRRSPMAVFRVGALALSSDERNATCAAAASSSRATIPTGTPWQDPRCTNGNGANPCPLVKRTGLAMGGRSNVSVSAFLFSAHQRGIASERLGGRLLGRRHWQTKPS
jgi:hypothetical protein